MFQYVIQDVLDSLQYLPAGLCAGFLAVFIIIIWNRLWHEHIRIFPGFLLGVYLTILAYLVFFNREVGSRDGVSLGLFETIGHGLKGDSYVVENIMLFVPLGILLPWLGRRHGSGWLYITIGCAASISIELLQFLTKRGYCQLDDIIMNTIGTVAGYLIYCICSSLGRRGGV